MRRWFIITLVALMPIGVLAKSDVRAQDATVTPPPGQPAQITYLGNTYQLLPDCYGTAFVVGINQTPLGQTDQLLTAIPFAGGVTVIPPKAQLAAGDLADKQMNDAICLSLTAKP